MQQDSYIAVAFAKDGSRRFCADPHGEIWTDDFSDAQGFPELYRAVGIANGHGGMALPWSDIQALEATS